MKRAGLDFEEIQPLQPKETELPNDSPLLLILNLLEIVALATSIFYLPYLSEECDSAPLKTWVIVIIATAGAYLLAFGMHQLLSQIGKSGRTTNWVMRGLYGLILFGQLAWLGVGHYWVFFKGLSCGQTPDFMAAVLLLVAFDALFLAVGLAFLVSVCSKCFKKEDHSYY